MTVTRCHTLPVAASDWCIKCRLLNMKQKLNNYNKIHVLCTFLCHHTKCSWGLWHFENPCFKPTHVRLNDWPITQRRDLIVIVIYPVVTSGVFKTKADFSPPIYPPGRNTTALTVTAERPPVGGHGAVTGEALPQLQTHSLVVAGVLCAGGAGTCRV